MLGRDHEKRAVADDRARHHAGVAVVLARRLLRASPLAEERSRCAAVAAVERRDRAVEAVRAALQSEVDRGAGCVAGLSVERVRLHLELGNRERRRRKPDDAGVVAWVRVVRRHTVRRTVEGEVVPPERSVGDDSRQPGIVHRT